MHIELQYMYRTLLLYPYTVSMIDQKKKCFLNLTKHIIRILLLLFNPS